MTAEFYRKGVENPVSFAAGTFLEIVNAEGTSAVVRVENAGQGFGVCFSNTKQDFFDYMEHGKKREDFFDHKYTAGDGVQLSDGGLLKAT